MESGRLQVFDFEALNWNKLYAVGIYDGKDIKYIAEKGRDNYYFTRWLMDNLEPDVIAYAHNGGRYDFIFVLQFCERENLKPYALKVIHGTVGEFRVKYKGKVLRFRDSMLILPASLKSLTYSFDVVHKKLEMDYDIGIDDSRFKDYFANDLYGLYEVLEASGLTSKLTIASNALSVFRSIFYTDKMERNSDDFENLFRKGYKGGRTEIFKMRGKDLNYYDINSLYPSVMYDFKYPLPIKDNFKKVSEFHPDKLGYYYIDAEIKDLKIPVLFYSMNGKFCFPVGKFQGFYYTPEINKAIEMGYKINVHFGYEFIKTDYLFRGYVEHFYKIKSESSGAKKAIAKLMLNSLYGKFGQRRNMEVNSFINDGTVSNMNYNIKKYWDEKSDFIHPEIVGLVTSYARVRLYELFQKAGLDKIYYCDTDSIITDTVLPTSSRLGDIKLEDKISEFIALAPKLYSYKNTSGDILIKSKGFKSEQFSFADFEAGLSGNTDKFIENRERLASFKERFKRKAVTQFSDLIQAKKRLRVLYDKRKIIDGYDTIPLEAKA